MRFGQDAKSLNLKSQYKIFAFWRHSQEKAKKIVPQALAREVWIIVIQLFLISTMVLWACSFLSVLLSSWLLSPWHQPVPTLHHTYTRCNSSSIVSYTLHQLTECHTFLALLLMVFFPISHYRTTINIKDNVESESSNKKLCLL